MIRKLGIVHVEFSHFKNVRKYLRRVREDEGKLLLLLSNLSSGSLPEAFLMRERLEDILKTD